MNDPIFWRLVWKEYRTQRWFWVGVAGLALVAQLIVLMAIDRPEARIVGVFSVAWWLPVFYALGCGAVLFAAEKEEETFELLRILPTSPDRLLASKLSFSFVSLAAMIGLLQVFAWGLALGDVPRDNAERLAGFAALAVEFLAWSVFFSLLTRRVLNAIVLAALAALAANLNSDTFSRCAVFAVVLCADAWLVRRWLSDRLTGCSFAIPFPGRRRSLAQLASVEERSPAWRRAFKRLLWQEVRHAFPVIVTLFTVGAILVFLSPWLYRIAGLDVAYLIIPLMPLFFGVGAFRGEQHGQRFRFLAERGMEPAAVWVSKHVVWMVALTGAMVFFLVGDHFAREVWHQILSDGNGMPNTGRVSFFADRDVFTVVRPRYRHFYYSPTLYWFFFASLIYSVGQLVSLFLAQAVMASFVGLVLAGVSVAWLYLIYFLDVPLPLSVAPIPPILLFATLVRCRSWMLEWNAWRVWLRVAAVLCLPLSVLVAGVAAYRVYEVAVDRTYLNEFRMHSMYLNGKVEKPDIAWPKDLALDKASVDELRTGDMYRFAMQLIQWPKKDEYPDEPKKDARQGWDRIGAYQRAWLEMNQEALQAALEATERDGCAFFDPSRAELDEVWLIQKIRNLDDLLLLSARKLEAEGHLDEALDRYLAALRMACHVANRAIHSSQWEWGCQIATRVYGYLPLWAAHPKQTPKRIASAIQRISEDASHFPSPSNALATERAMLLNALAENSDSLFVCNDGEIGRVVGTLLARYCPWERARAIRVLDTLTIVELRDLESAEDDLRDPDRRASRPYRNFYLASHPSIPLLETTPALKNTRSFSCHLCQPDLAEEIGNREQTLRGNLTVMAIVAWRLQHGELPQSLGQLVGTFLDYPLPDPWSLAGFVYYPNGLPLDYGLTINGTTVERGDPFLWSPGQWDVHPVPFVLPNSRPNRQVRYSLISRTHGWALFQKRDDECEYPTVGIFPIPKSAGVWPSESPKLRSID